MVPKADRLKDIEFSKIRLLNQKVEELQAEGREMCTFTIGQPDFPTPQYIKDACTKALNDGFTGYGSYTGSLNFRQAVVDKYKSMLKTKSLLNKKEINEKICRYRGYYLECLDIANLLEARYKGVM